MNKHSRGKLQRIKTRFMAVVSVFAMVVSMLAGLPLKAYADTSTALNPNSIQIGYNNPVTVNVTDTGAHFASGNFRVQLVGSNVGDKSSYVDNSKYNVVDNSHASFVLSTGLPRDSYNVTVYDSYDGNKSEGTFTVYPTATISPSVIAQNYSSPITIDVYGNDTRFDNQSFAVTIKDKTGKDVPSTVSGTQVYSTNHASFVLNTGLAGGAYTVYVTDTEDQSLVGNSGINAGILSIQAATISPNTAYVGYDALKINIQGSNTHFNTGNFQVFVYDQNGNVPNCGTAPCVSISGQPTDATSANFTLNPGLSSGIYTIYFSDSTDGPTPVYAGSFTINQPSVGITPTSTQSGYALPIQIKISGTGLHFTKNFKTYVFDSQGNDVTSTAVASFPAASASDDNDASFYLNTGLKVGTYFVYASDDTDKRLLAGTFTVTSNASATISPSSEAYGYTGPVTISITGTNTHFTQGFKLALKNSSGTDITGTYVNGIPTVTSDTAATFQLNSGLPQGNYTVNISDTPDGALPSIAFQVFQTGPVTLQPGTVYTNYSAPFQINVQGTATHFNSGSFAVTMTDSQGNDVTSKYVAVLPPASSSSATQGSFYLNSGMTAGTYNVVVSDSTDGKLPPAQLTLAAPTAALQTTSALVGYSSPINDTIKGSGTNFQLPDFKITVTDSNGKDVTSAAIVSGSTSTPDNNTANFQIATGLAAGSYKFSVTDTKDGTLQAGTFTVNAVKPQPSGTVITGTAPTVDLTPSAQTTTDSSGNATVTVDSTSALKQIQNSSNATQYFVINVDSSSAPSVAFTVNNDVVQATTSRAATLVFATSQGAYAMTPEVYSAVKGQTAAIASLTLRVGSPALTTVNAISQYNFQKQLNQIGKPLEFILAVTNTNGQSSVISRYGSTFAGFVIELGSAQLDVNHTNALFYDGVTGALEAAPTYFVGRADGTVAALVYRTGNGAYEATSANKTFDDIQGHWAQSYIEIMASKQYVFGRSDSIFDPQGNITRAEFAAEVVRALAVGDIPNASANFSDVSQSDWYYHVVAIAQQLGIVNGYGDGTFGPNAYITRQDMATMIARAIHFKNVNESADTSNLNQFSDASQIADYAKPGAAICVQDGIIKGQTPTEFKPLLNATRAEATTMVERMMSHLNLLHTN